MPRYTQDGVSFEPPQGWLDAAVVTLIKPNPKAMVCALIVKKEPLRDEESILTYLRRRLVTLSLQLQDFSSYGTRAWTIAGRPAFVLDYSSAPTVKSGPPIVQSLYGIELARDENEFPQAPRIALSFTFASSDQGVEDLLMFAEMLKTVRFAPDEEAARRAAANAEAVTDVPMPGSSRLRAP